MKVLHIDSIGRIIDTLLEEYGKGDLDCICLVMLRKDGSYATRATPCDSNLVRIGMACELLQDVHAAAEDETGEAGGKTS